jgi:hypothetical protein
MNLWAGGLKLREGHNINFEGFEQRARRPPKEILEKMEAKNALRME